MISNTYLMIFAMAMTGCVLATPLVTWVATWVGAIDRPDQFRRIHKGAVPRLGGLALALGRGGRNALDPTARPAAAAGPSANLAHTCTGRSSVAALIILVVGFIDDTRSLCPRVKLLGQALAVLTLYLGGIRIESIDVLGLNLDLGFPSARFDVMGFPFELALPSLVVTLLLVPRLHECLEPDRRHGRARVRSRLAGERHVDTGGDPQRELRGRGPGGRAGGKSRGLLAVQLAPGLHFSR